MVVYEKILEMVMGPAGSSVRRSRRILKYLDGNARPPLSLGRASVSGVASSLFFV